jgi:asparagine N-glycosylation enzyme membrane subunit Stt3
VNNLLLQQVSVVVQIRGSGRRLCSGIAHEKEPYMLWTIFVILLVLWLLGLVSSYTLGGYIHILLVVAVIVLVFNLLSGRRSV